MNAISFSGGETAGSIGIKSNNQIRKNPIETPLQTPGGDTVNFRGKDYEESSSAGKTLLKGLVSIAVIVGALGLAHKKDVFGKIKNADVKKYIEKATEPCYKICHKAKELATAAYNKVKDKFSK